MITSLILQEVTSISKLALPFMITNIMTFLMPIVDLIVLGHLNKVF